MSYGFIYKTTFPNGKIYIGQTIRSEKLLYFGSGLKCYRAIKKYGIENLERKILRFCKNQDELNKWEQIFILKFNSTNSSIGYNIEYKSFGQGRFSEETIERLRLSGANISEETRRKRSEAQKGKKFSEDAKRKMSEAKKGKKRPPVSEETKLKMSLAQKGKKMSLESREKIGLAGRGRIPWNKGLKLAI